MHPTWTPCSNCDPRTCAYITSNHLQIDQYIAAMQGTVGWHAGHGNTPQGACRLFSFTGQENTLYFIWRLAFAYQVTTWIRSNHFGSAIITIHPCHLLVQNNRPTYYIEQGHMFTNIPPAAFQALCFEHDEWHPIQLLTAITYRIYAGVKIGGVYRLLRNLSIGDGLVKNTQIVVTGYRQCFVWSNVRTSCNTTPNSELQSYS